MSGRQPENDLVAVNDFFVQVGFAITAWAHVDESLFRIFQACVGPAKQCAIIYYRTPGLDSRFKLVDEIVLSVLPERINRNGGHDHASVKAWKKTIAPHEGLLKVRRRIAHHPVSPKWTSQSSMGGDSNLDGGKPDPVLSFDIYANEMERLRRCTGENETLGLSDLKDHSNRVRHLDHELHTFATEVLEKYL